MNMLESYSEYQRLAKRTMRRDDREKLILHCTMGMVGEAGELLQFSPDDTTKHEQRVGELGDMAWYVTNLLDTLGYHLDLAIPQMEQVHEDSELDGLPSYYAMIWAAELCDEVKKGVFYGKVIPDSVIYNLACCYLSSVIDECKRIEVPVLEVLSRNIAKLEARYPNLRFESDKAINRDYEAESRKAGITIV